MLQNGLRHISYIVLLMIVGLLCTLHALLPSYQPSCWQSFSLLGGQSAAAMTACPPSRDPAVYTRHQLLGLRCVPGSKSKVYVNEVAIHGLLRYRGNRAGRVTHRRQDRASVYKHDPDRQPGSIQTVHSRLKAQPTQQSGIPVVTARRSATTRYRPAANYLPTDRPRVLAAVRCVQYQRPRAVDQHDRRDVVLRRVMTHSTTTDKPVNGEQPLTRSSVDYRPSIYVASTVALCQRHRPMLSITVIISDRRNLRSCSNYYSVE